MVARHDVSTARIRATAARERYASAALAGGVAAVPWSWTDVPSFAAVPEAADELRVWQAAVPTLRGVGADRVLAVAQPLLHRAKAHRLIRRSGFTPVRARVGRIGFDRSPANTQWWTRGPLRLVAYALLQAATGRGGR